jgi:hypothetical protein
VKLSSRCHAARAGTAALELVLVLPLLVACAAMLLVLGHFGLGSLEATVTARREAWQQRSQHRAPDPLALPSLRGSSPTVCSDVSRPLTGLPPVLPGQYTAHARVKVSADAGWDHRDLPLDQPPRWGPHPRLLPPVVRGMFSLDVPDLTEELGRFTTWAENGNNRLQAGLHEYEQKQVEAQREIDRLNREIEALEEKRRATLRIKDEQERLPQQSQIDAQLAPLQKERSKWQAGLEQLQKHRDALRPSTNP